MKKDLALIGGLLLLVVALMIFGGGFSSTSFLLNNQNNSTPSASTQSSEPEITSEFAEVTIRSLTVNAKVAANLESRKRGLAKRTSLPINQGMLFVFGASDSYSIWMKDMKFPIDIVWINSDKKVVDIVENAKAEPGRKDKDLTIYKPKADALYILEVNAGLVNANSIQIGDPVDFSL